MDAIGGHAVLPVDTYVAAPFLIELVPKSAGDMPRDANSSRHRGASVGGWWLSRFIVARSSGRTIICFMLFVCRFQELKMIITDISICRTCGGRFII